MMTTRSLLIVAGALAVAAPLASRVLADDPPRFEKLNKDKAKKGSMTTVQAMGSGFGDKKDDVEVQAGSTKCNVVGVTPTAITFMLPGTLALGPATVSIKVRGASFSARIQIVDKVEKTAENNIERPGGVEKNPFLNRDMHQAKLTLNGGDNPSAVIEGTTQIPAGLLVNVTFGIKGANGEADQQIETKPIKLPKGNFKVTFTYQGKRFSTGKYMGTVDFQLEGQDAKDLGTAKWDKLTESQRRDYNKLWAEDFQDYGSPEDAKKELEETKAHYVLLAKMTTTVIDKVEQAYGAAGKCFFKKSSGYDEDAWTKWLKDFGLGTNDDELKKLKSDSRFLRGTYLNPDAWQAWLEQDVWTPLRDQRKAHDALHDKYVGSKNQKMDEEGYQLVSLVGKLAQTYSIEIYNKNKVELPDVVKTPKGIFDQHEVPSSSRPEFENRKKVLLERLEKLGAPAVPPAPPKKQ
jgi:hypothetical protein